MSRKRQGVWKLKRMHERGFIALFVQASTPYLHEFPHMVDAWIYRGMSFTSISRYDDAQRSYERALEFATPDLRSIIWWKKAEIYKRKGDFEAAIDCLNCSVELDPTEGEYWSFIGEMMALREDWWQAEETLRWALASDCRKSEHIYTVLAQVFTAQERYSEARNCYEKALELSPNFTPAFAGRSELENYQWFKAHHKGSSFKDNYAEIVQDTPLISVARFEGEDSRSNPLNEIYYGRALTKIGRCREAITAFQRIRTKGIEHTLAYHSWISEGHAQSKRGNYSDAEHCYESATAVLPQVNTAHIFWGNLIFEIGEFERAEKILRRALQLEGEKDEALFNLGGVLLAQERYEEAAQCYRDAIKIDPDYTLAKIRLLDLELAMRWQAKHCL